MNAIYITYMFFYFFPYVLFIIGTSPYMNIFIIDHLYSKSSRRSSLPSTSSSQYTLYTLLQSYRVQSIDSTYRQLDSLTVDTIYVICIMYIVYLQAGRPKKSFLFGPFFFNITNVFCAKKWVGHACICPRMVTGQPVLKLYPPKKVSFPAAKK